MVKKYVTQSIHYVCGSCDGVYDTKEGALKCEVLDKRHKSRKKYFPLRHPDSSKYKRLCISCGKTLLTRERESDNHRSYAGGILWQIPHTSVLRSPLCLDCASIFEDWMITRLKRSPLIKEKRNES